MNRCVTSRKAAFAVLAMSVLSVPVLAGERPIKGSGVSTIVGTEGPFLVLERTGEATVLGPFTGMARVFVKQNGRRYEFTTSDTGANGDSLDTSGEGMGDPEAGVWMETIIFTGGTGRFENATGSGTVNVVQISPGTFYWTFEGSISF